MVLLGKMQDSSASAIDLDVKLERVAAPAPEGRVIHNRYVIRHLPFIDLSAPRPARPFVVNNLLYASLQCAKARTAIKTRASNRERCVDFLICKKIKPDQQ
jgi:hypothetical protein